MVALVRYFVARKFHAIELRAMRENIALAYAEVQRVEQDAGSTAKHRTTVRQIYENLQVLYLLEIGNEE